MNFQTVRHTIRRAVYVHGFRGSAKILAQKIRARHEVPVTSAFDARFAVQTDGNEGLTALQIETTETERHLFERYQPTDESIIRAMLEAQPIQYRESVFIDMGSGKGRVLLVASEYPFRQIIGVEFARDLHEIAAANVKAYQSPTQQCRNFDLACTDGTTFRLPPEPTVLFMANPFRGAMMAKFLENVEASLREFPRPFHVLYRQATEAPQWDGSPYFKRIAESGTFVNYRAR